ncbi:MAG: hypothetical protein L0Y54_21175, partial [Sporichthyaceae bacterium]|nr:hypothetical protein [Sporichthyaceae bacterium]
DADGLGAFGYQWLRNGLVIAGATTSTYTLGDADVGSQISVQVGYTDARGTVEGPLTSAQTAAVANVNDVPVGVPTITGTATEDQTLTANTAGIGDADGLGAFGYQWLRNGLVVAGATTSSYTLGDADVGTQISVQVGYTDARGTVEGPLTSAQTAAVADVNDVPVIIGTSPPSPSPVPGPIVIELPPAPVPTAEPPADEPEDTRIDVVFSPGRVLENFDDLSDMALRLAEVEARVPLKILRPEPNLNTYEPKPSSNPELELLMLSTELSFTGSTPVDWGIASAFDESAGEQVRSELEVLLDSVKFGGMALSVGVVWWASRISGLLGTLLASTPAWRHIDPLPVLAREDEEE